MKFNLPLNNFGAGEWSPKMQSRTDAEQYPRSCKEVTNMLIQMQGGAQYRGGTSLLNLAGASITGPGTALLVSNTEPTKDFKLIPSLEKESPLVFMTGRQPVFTDPAVTISYPNSFPLGWVAKDTQYQQVGDVLVLVNSLGLYEPMVIYRLSPGVYILRYFKSALPTLKPWKTNPWGDINALGSNVTLTTPGTVTGSFTLTSSAAYFSASMVGKYIRLCNGTSLDGVVQITAYLTTTTVTVNALQTVPNATFTYGSTANASSFWQISQWGNDTGWPRTVTSFQGRLIFGGYADGPDTINGSRISNVFDFEEVPGPNTTGVYGFASSAFLTDNSRPFTLTPNSAQSSNIVALSSAKTLNIHTDALEITAYGSNGALGPNNVVFDSSTSFGASTVQPVRVNNYSTFIQKNGYKVRDIVYNFNEDQYKSSDLGFLAEHLFLRTNLNDVPTGTNSNKARTFPVDDIVEMCKYESRSSFLLCLTRSGKLNYVTLDRDYSVNAWGRFVLGSEAQEQYPYTNQPIVLSVCSLENRLYVLVARNFNGTLTLTCEKLNEAWEYPNYADTHTYIESPRYLDCAWKCTSDNALPATVFKVGASIGSLHFVGATLSVVADGNYIGEVTLDPLDSDGTFTLPLSKSATNVYVGYKYPGVLQSSGLEAGGQYGSPVGRLKKIDQVVVKLYKTGSAKIGKDRDNLEEIVIRKPSVPMNQPTPFFTGNKTITFSQGHEQDYSVLIIQDKPYPLYVVSISASGVTDD